MRITLLSWCGKALSVSLSLLWVVFKSLCDLLIVFLSLILWNSISSKANGAPQARQELVYLIEVTKRKYETCWKEDCV
jgi:hypothetical protein